MLVPKSSISFILAATTAISFSASAESDYVNSLEQRIADLEAKVNLEPVSSIGDRIAFGGVVEVEAATGDSEDFSDRSYSSLSVATVELALSAELSEKVGAEIVMLYEEGDTPFDVDVATLRLDQLFGPVNLTVGKQYLPFGRFETALVNDTLALELGETNKTAGLFAMEQGGLSGGLYLFDGDVDREKHLENWGLTFSYGEETWNIGVDYISSLAESDSLSEAPEAGFEYQSDDGGISVAANWERDNVVFMGEYLTAIDDIVWSNGINSLNAEPSAIHLEVSLGTDIQGRNYTFAVAAQQTDEAGGALPEQRLSFGCSTTVYDGLGVGLEFWHDVDYDQNEGGSGNSANNIVLQLAAEI